MLQKLNDLIEDLQNPSLLGRTDRQAVETLAVILKEYIERNVFVPLCTLPKMKNEVTLKLTKGIQAEVERILKTTDLKDVGDIFKHGFTFLVQHLNAELNGYEIHIVDEVNQPIPVYKETIELPFRIRKGGE